MTLKEFIKSLRVGDAKKFAARLGVSPSYLSQMASGRTAISPTRALMIESATEGQVSRAELRPMIGSLFGLSMRAAFVWGKHM